MPPEDFHMKVQMGMYPQVSPTTLPTVRSAQPTAATTPTPTTLAV